MPSTRRAEIGTNRRHCAAATALTLASSFALLGLLLAPASGLAQQDLGVDITGRESGRDNTRVQGTVYDSAGNNLTDIQIWVTNVDAPANRVRARTRKTGTYLARSLDRLFGPEDLHGINLRLRFEKDGYQVVESTLVVQKDGLGEVYPILYKEGEDVAMSGICTVLRGAVTRDGKPVKEAAVKIKGSNGDFALEVTADKKGVYEALLWNAPPHVEVQTAGETQHVNLLDPPQQDVVPVQLLDIALEG